MERLPVRARARATQKKTSIIFLTLDELEYCVAGSDFCSTASAARVSAILASVALARSEPWEGGGGKGAPHEGGSAW